MSAIYKGKRWRISIRKNPSRKNGKVYPGFEVRESMRGSHITRQTFAVYKEAKEYADEREAFITGQSRPLSPTDRARFDLAVRTLAPTGIPLDMCAGEFADAKRELGELEASMAELARFYRAHHKAGTCKKTVGAVVGELVARRRKEGASGVHLRDLEQRLTRFAKDVACAISDLSAPVLQLWLDGLNLGNRSVRNYRTAISNLIGFAKMRGYLPADFHELQRLDKIKLQDQPIQIFTPDEMRYLLSHAAESILPVLLLGGFAGLRTSETLLMHWAHVDWQQNSLIVPPEGKTKERRVPMEPNLRAWLEPIRSRGRLVPISKHGISKAYDRTVMKANRALRRERVALVLDWKHNALRHSCASYWARLHENPYRVAGWTGHSARTLKKFYCNQTVTDEAAKAWFAIYPEHKAVQLSLFTLVEDEKTCPETARNGAA